MDDQTPSGERGNICMSSKITFSNRDLKSLIIPLIIETVLAVTVGIEDTIMVSSVGEAAVSGVSLVEMINVLLINLMAALATGGAVVASQYLGARQREKACKSASQLLLVTMLFSSVIMVLSIVLRVQILRLFFGEIDADVMSSGLTYFWISAISYPLIGIYNSCAALYRVMGHARIPMYSGLVINILNITGNAVFIYGLHWGVAGVSVSSLISRLIGTVFLLWLIKNPKRDIYIQRRSFRPDFASIRKILFIGIPSGLENSLFQLGRVLVVSIIASFGTVQIAANAVANNIDTLGCIPGQALSLAMITVVGRCVGACDFSQAKYYAKKLLKITYVITACLNTVILLFLPLILKVYNLSDDTLQLAYILVFIHNGFAILLWPTAFTLPNALRAASDVRFTMVVSIVSMCVFRLVFSYILGIVFGYGAIGVWIAMIMDWICRAALFAWRFHSGKWTTKYVPDLQPRI